MRSGSGRRRNTRAALAAGAVLAAAIAVAGTQLPAGAAAPSAAAPTAATFTDDFNGAAGSAPDASKWVHEIGDNGGNNHELEYYTDSTSNAALDGNGDLVITARQENPAGYTCWYGTCQYTSARLNTSQSFTQAYGHFEARMKLPAGQGLWPAFWLLGDNINSAGWPNCGELDVMENLGQDMSTVYGSAHGPGYSGGSALTAGYTLPNGGSFADFHTFAIDWSPDSVSWSVDGTVYETHTPADTNGNQWVFDHPFFIILNLAVGGDWPGSPDSSTQFPAQMVVDYVHVSASDSASAVRR